MFHVKHQGDIEELMALADSAAVSITRDQAAALLEHWLMVQDAGAKQNLTAIRETPAAIRLHILDSLVVVPVLRRLAPGGGLVVDLGAGAGYPGVPIAVATAWPVLLLEPREKRAVFLQSVCDALHLSDVTVERARAEKAAKGRYRESAVAVVARAVASLPALVELAAPLLREGGILVALKGRIEQSELVAGRGAGTVVGLEYADSVSVDLPGGDEVRQLIVYRKTSSPTLQLPRREGLAQKRPLG